MCAVHLVVVVSDYYCYAYACAYACELCVSCGWIMYDMDILTHVKLCSCT